MRKPKVSARRREQLLKKFEGSGLSAAEFARVNELNYTTFCGWRRRYPQPEQQRKPKLVEVELPASNPAGVEVQIGRLTRLRITDGDQARLAARLIRDLEGVSC